MTNKLKKQLKQLSEEYEIKLKIVNRLHDMFDKLNLLDYTYNAKRWNSRDRSLEDNWERRWFPLGNELRNKVNKQYEEDRSKLLCIKKHRIYRYGKHNCWVEHTEQQLKRIERRHQAKQKYIARLYEQGMQAEDQRNRDSQRANCIQSMVNALQVRVDSCSQSP